MNAQEMVPPGFQAPGPPQRPPGSGLQPESLPAELAEDISQVPTVPNLGPYPVSDVRFLMDTLGFKNAFGDSGIRTFGWVEGVTPARRAVRACSRSSRGRTGSVTSSCSTRSAS